MVDSASWQTVHQEALERDEGRCQVCGGKENLHVHHVKPRGMGGNPAADRVENLITVCGECHRRLHNEWRIVRFDPSAGVLHIVDIKRKKAVPEEQLWFYRKRNLEKLKAQLIMLEEIAGAYLESRKALALIFANLADNADLLPELGYSSMEEVAHECGFTVPEARRLASSGRAYVRLAEETGVCPEKLATVPVDVAPFLVHRDMPDEKRKEIIEMSVFASRAAVLAEARGVLKGKRQRTFYVFHGKYREVHAFDEEEVDVADDEVVVVGRVIKGSLRHGKLEGGAQ